MAGKRRSIFADAIEKMGTPSPAMPAPGAGNPEKALGADISDTGPDETNEGGSTSPGFLARRIDKLDVVGRNVKRPMIRLTPDECTIWAGNARVYDDLTYERCETLIQSIRAEGRNREAVVVRRVENGPKPYELLVGTRRHWSISWLHANNHSEIEFIARIETLDDEGAFRLADIENREREDVTDLERARNYLHAVDAYYGGFKNRMAERLAIPTTTLYSFIKLGELSDEVIAAFPGTASVKAAHANKLSPHLNVEIERNRILAEAGTIATEQAAHRANGDKLIEASRVCDRLIAAAKNKLGPKPRSATKAPPQLFSGEGNLLGHIVADTAKKGMTITINPAELHTVDEILDALRPALEAAKFQKKI